MFSQDPGDLPTRRTRNGNKRGQTPSMYLESESLSKHNKSLNKNNQKRVEFSLETTKNLAETSSSTSKDQQTTTKSIVSSEDDHSSQEEEVNQQSDLIHEIDNEEKDFTLRELIFLAKKKHFPNKISFYIDDKKTKGYTQILHAFTFTRRYENKPKSIQLISKERNCVLNCKIGDFSNINKHFKADNHPLLKEWYGLYQKIVPIIKQTKVLPDNLLNVIKFFIGSDTALNQLKNPLFTKILDPSIKLYSIKTFRYKLLPAIFEKLNKEIERKLKNATYVTLLTDAWTGQLSNVEFLALGAQIIDNLFNQEILIIGMVEIVGGHCAENIQAAIEKIINQYNFDKNKIKG